MRVRVAPYVNECVRVCDGGDGPTRLDFYLVRSSDPVPGPEGGELGSDSVTKRERITSRTWGRGPF